MALCTGPRRGSVPPVNCSLAAPLKNKENGVGRGSSGELLDAWL